MKSIYGKKYDEDLKRILEITKDRNKIFHGQLTDKKLNRKQLIEYIETMRLWSKTISERFTEEVGYDGFGRNSYRKAIKEINLNNLGSFSSLENYTKFLKSIDRYAKKE